VQCDHARLRITENPAHRRLRAKACERIRIPQPPVAFRCSCHPEFMPNIASLEMQNPLAIPDFLAFSTQKLPTRFHEDPDFCSSRHSEQIKVDKEVFLKLLNETHEIQTHVYSDGLAQLKDAMSEYLNFHDV
jgi:hypothetical protein